MYDYQARGRQMMETSVRASDAARFLADIRKKIKAFRAVHDQSSLQQLQTGAEGMRDLHPTLPSYHDAVQECRDAVACLTAPPAEPQLPAAEVMTLIQQALQAINAGVGPLRERADANNATLLKAAADLYQRTQNPEKAAILSAYLDTLNIAKAAKRTKMSVGKAHKLIREIEVEHNARIMRRAWAQGEHAGNAYKHGKNGPLRQRDLAVSNI
jgi:hypothetical protein